MTYDEALAARVRDLVTEHGEAEEKKMFGGLGFLLGGNLAVCASHDGGLLVRTDGSDADELLARDHVEPMVMGGRSSRTWLRVDPTALRTDESLGYWVGRGATTATALPTKG
jgi:TfoX/Sxy family transcriptional regulator of competence genes